MPSSGRSSRLRWRSFRYASTGARLSSESSEWRWRSRITMFAGGASPWARSRIAALDGLEAQGERPGLVLAGPRSDRQPAVRDLVHDERMRQKIAVKEHPELLSDMRTGHLGESARLFAVQLHLDPVAVVIVHDLGTLDRVFAEDVVDRARRLILGGARATGEPPCHHDREGSGELARAHDGPSAAPC